MEGDSQQEKNAFVEHFLRQTMFCGKNENEVDKRIGDLRRKPIMLVNETKMTWKKRKKNRKTFLPNRTVVLRDCKYSDYEPLRKLWREYIDELLVLKDNEQLDLGFAQQMLLKADYHGAAISVAKSNCKSYENVCGTVITESKNMFQIVTKNDKVVKIPKKNSIFEVIHAGYRITIFGDQFCVKPSQRLTKKFKSYIAKFNVV